MNAERMIGSLIRGAIGGRGKRGSGALRFLTGGRNSFLNASTLLTVAGVAWGLLESAVPNTGSASPMPAPSSGWSGASAPPPLPGRPAAESALPPISGELHRLIRLTISAARADGRLSPGEREEILTHARESGAEAWVQLEIDHELSSRSTLFDVNRPRRYKAQMRDALAR